MENASKALIIAGAILLSILIITLGVFVFNQAKGAMSGVNMDAQVIDSFNQPFLAYEGSQLGSSVKSLAQKVNSHNNTVDDKTYITMWKGTSDGSIREFVTEKPTIDLSAVSTGKRYNITFHYNKAGYITYICFDEK